jgi:hypothetical protein
MMEALLRELVGMLTSQELERAASYLVELAPALLAVLAHERDPERSHRFQVAIIAEAVMPSQPQPQEGVKWSPAIDAWLAHNHLQLVPTGEPGKLSLIPDDAPLVHVVPVRFIAADEASGKIYYTFDDPEQEGQP